MLRSGRHPCPSLGPSAASRRARRVHEKTRPVGGDHGPKGSSGKQERDPFSEIATWKQGDRRDPVTVIIAGAPVAKGRRRMTRRGFVVADDAQIVEVYAKKEFSVAPKMIATILPLDATPSNRRTSR